MKSRNTTSDLSILTDLKHFEAGQEKKLAEAIENAGLDVEKAKADALKELEKAKAAVGKKVEAAVNAEREKAEKEAGKLFSDFEEKEKSLKKNFAKNKAKAVKAVFDELLE